MTRGWIGTRIALLAGLVLGLYAGAATGQTAATKPAADRGGDLDVLSSQQRKLIDESVDRALAWLATRQGGEGGFQTLDTGQPGVTSLCVLAFLGRGHLPGEGRYGQVLNQAIQYTLDCQQPDGVFSRIPPTEASRPVNASYASSYNHPITGLMLAEVYGMTKGDLNRHIRPAIEKAIQYSGRRLPQPKRKEVDEGGWRYRTHYHNGGDADLSITSWNLMFLRSCKNAGFEVPTALIDDALKYVGRVYRDDIGTFAYSVDHRQITSRAMAGAGILSFSLGGKHGDNRAQRAGEYILSHPFINFNVWNVYYEQFYYSCFYSSMGMFQLGGKYWKEFYPPLARTLIANQHRDGSWEPDSHSGSKPFGETYSTAMAVLALSPPYQLLPIFQR